MRQSFHVALPCAGMCMAETSLCLSSVHIYQFWIKAVTSAWLPSRANEMSASYVSLRCPPKEASKKTGNSRLLKKSVEGHQPGLASQPSSTAVEEVLLRTAAVLSPLLWQFCPLWDLMDALVLFSRTPILFLFPGPLQCLLKQTNKEMQKTEICKKRKSILTP